MITRHALPVYLILLGGISLLALAGADPLINVPSYPLEYCLKQLQWYTVALILFFSLRRIRPTYLVKLAYVAYYVFLMASALLALSHLFDLNLPLTRRINGSTAWYEIPGVGTIQPSEFLKIWLVVILADLFSRHPLHSLRQQLGALLKGLAYLLPACLFTLLQNDSGVTMIMLAGTFVMFLCLPLAKRLYRYLVLVLLGLVGLAILVILWHPDWLNSLLNSYRGGRIAGWLDPEGYYATYGYQLYNALLSFGGAGLWGHGFQTVLMPIPEPQTDFIFAVILQDAGLIGGMITLAIMLGFDLCILKSAKKTARPFFTYVMMGMLGLLLFQQFWNVGMVLQVLPITGITLPFISYGGSSLVSYFILLAYFPASKARIQNDKPARPQDA